MRGVEALGAGMWVVSDLVAADGRVSWVPVGASGAQPFNEYLLCRDEHALLIDTGVALHGPGIAERLVALVGARRLSIYATRIELDCLGNLAVLLEWFPEAEVVTANPISPLSLVHRATLDAVPVSHLRFGDDLARFGFPELRVLEPLIRTLGTSWLHDRASRALFTSDCFCGDLIGDVAGPIIRDDGMGLPSAAVLRAHLLAKFDWLAQADLESLDARWQAFFAPLDLAILAPIHGRPARGSELVTALLARYRQGIVGGSPSAGREANSNG